MSWILSSGTARGACLPRLLLLLAASGCSEPNPPTEQLQRSTRAAELGLPTDTVVELAAMRGVEDFDREVAQFKSVFWDPADTISLRRRIRAESLVGKEVLEIGTGTGLLSLCCLRAGAAKVVATDINPSAIANAVYNAELLEMEARFEARLVRASNPAAFGVILANEKFDLIVSNPPWEDGEPREFADYAYYDPGFKLLDSLFANLRDHLRPDGKVWLAYGCVEAIRAARRLASRHDLRLTILDERSLDDLEPVFLPGMLLEVRLE